MADYKKIKELCDFNTSLTASVVDEFLLYYAAEQDKLDRKAKTAFARYRHVSKGMPEGWYGMAMAQFIAHNIFKKDGLVQRYKNHRAIELRNEAELTWLGHHAKHPWRFSFAEIIDSLAKDFYTMEDVFNAEHYLLYSTGTTKELEIARPALWFNLISWNGACWQTYGTIVPFRGFEADDICYFTHRLYPGLDLKESRKPMPLIEKNPVPYMMLFSGSEYPLVFQQDIQTVYNIAEYYDDSFYTDGLEASFKIEYAQDVYRLGLKGWDTFPHFATAYYDERKKELFLSALSDEGFDRLSGALENCGYELSEEPDYRVNPGMHATANQVLKSKYDILRYDHLFSTETPEQKEQTDHINAVLQKILPDINAGREPDVQKLAKEAGMDPGDLQEIVDTFKKKLGRI